MATEILQMVVDPVTLSTSAPLVTIGGTLGARNANISMPLTYKDGRIPAPFRSGGYDPRLSTDGLIAAPRTCKVTFDELFTATNPNYRSVYDKYAAAFGDATVVGLVFRTADNLQRLRFGRLLDMPFTADTWTPRMAHMEMTFAVEMYAHDLYPPSAVFYDTAGFTYDGTSHYDAPPVVLPITGASQSITFTTPATATVVDVAMQLQGPITGPITVTIYYGPGNAYSTSVAINDTLIVNPNGYIDYYLVDSGTETVTKDGIEIFDQSKIFFPPGQNDWLRVGKVTSTLVAASNTLTVTCPGTGLGLSSAAYLTYTAHYL